MRRLLLASLLLFLASSPAAAQSFGNAAAVAGDEVLFTQPQTDAVPGTVFVYRRASAAWTEADRLQASDGIPGDRFGHDVSVDGGRMVVGAFWADSGRGGAYVFERSGDGRWSETARLVPEGAVRGDSVGVAVALEGDLALVAATAGDSAVGRVYAFRRASDGSWRAAGELAAPGAEPGDRFGRALDLAGGSAFVGAAGRDSLTGAVWAFPADEQGWGEPTLVPGPTQEARFGTAVLGTGERLLVGAPGLDRARGAVVVLERDADGAWSEVARLLPFEGTPQTLFGTTIAAAGDEVWVGGPGADRFQGAAFRFVRDPETNEWSESVRVTVDDLQSGTFFAGAIGLGTAVAAAGIPGADYGAGSGAIFERREGTWRLATLVESEVEGLEPIVGSPIECGDGKAARFSCSSVDLVSFVPVQALGGERGVELNDVWGWTDPETGREYALVGRVDGTSFVDITDPANPVYLGNLPRTEGSPGSTWRDIKVYEDHAFIVADNAGQHGVQIFDLTKLRDVEDAPVTFTEDARYDGIASAHNIVINEDSGFAYAVGAGEGGETCGGGLHMIDIRDPRNPTFAGCFADPSTGRQKTGYTHDAQCVTYQGPDPDYQGREICFGSNETALSIADVTDKENPVAVAMAEYPNVGYTHQAWLTEDHRYLLMDDELDEMQGLVENTRTLVWDVSDLDDPVLLTEYFNPNTVSIDHNLFVKGDKVYQSNYVTGLRVLDISDIENPVEVGFFDTVPYGSDGPRFDGSWSNYPFFESGTIVVTSGDEGLFLLKYRPTGDRPVS